MLRPPPEPSNTPSTQGYPVASHGVCQSHERLHRLLPVVRKRQRLSRYIPNRPILRLGLHSAGRKHGPTRAKRLPEPGDAKHAMISRRDGIGRRRPLRWSILRLRTSNPGCRSWT